MTTYQIINKTSGADLGTYEGNTALDAYRAMMADAGYRTEADAQSAGLTLAAIPSDITVADISTTDGDDDDDQQRAADLEAGIERVDAYEWRGGYAYDADDEGMDLRYCGLTEGDLIWLGELLRADDDEIRRDAYSLWCAGTTSESEGIDTPE